MEFFKKYKLFISSIYLSTLVFPLDILLAKNQFKTGIDSLGNSIAVWMEQTENGSIINSAKLSALSNTWSKPKRISPIDQKANNPQIAVNSSGNAIAIWVGNDENNSHEHLYGALLFNGTWGDWKILSNNNESSFSDIDLKINDDGNAIVTWNCYLFDGKTNNKLTMFSLASVMLGTWSNAIMSPSTADEN